MLTMCVTEKCLERLSSSSAHTADSSRASRRGSLPFCHFKVDSSRLVHFSGVFREFLARCTAVAVELHALSFMFLFVTPGSGVARCPSWVLAHLLQALLTLCVCHATRLRLSQLFSGRVELDWLFCCTSFNAGTAFHVERLTCIIMSSISFGSMPALVQGCVHPQRHSSRPLRVLLSAVSLAKS